jgi:glutamate-1-semialdehyde aminotransferase
VSIDFDIWRRAQDAIGQGALTNSKHPERHVFGCYPTHIRTASGAFLFDDKGDKYTDYICGLGANLFGYGNPYIVNLIKYALSYGASHSLPTYYEVEYAEELKEIFYFCDRFKFLKSGSEACTAAVRMARAYNDRPLILSDGYHGWHDMFVSLTPPARGVHDHFMVKKLSDWDFANFDNSKVCAVIVEPVITSYSTERYQYLQTLREICTKYGIILIFDEVITGFRFPKQSVSAFFNVIPDLILLGKAMANGSPLSAVGGKKDILDGEYFVSSTYAGDIYSLTAAKGVLDIIRQNLYQYKIERLWESGLSFIERFNEMGQGKIRINGYPTRGVFEGDPMVKVLFFQEAAKAKMLFCNSWFYNYHLINEDFHFFEFFSCFMKNLNNIKLEGKMPISPFAERVRNG